MFKTDIIKCGAEMFLVHPRDLVGPARFKFLMLPRFAVSKALRMRGYSLPHIGALMNRDHSSIIYQISRAEYHMERDPEYAAKINELATMKAVPVQLQERISDEEEDIFA